VTIQSVNPRTGESFGPQFTDMGASEVAGVIDASLSVFSQWSASQPSERKRAIYAIADAIDANRDELVELSDLETGLGKARLTGELARTTFQLRMFADAVAIGEFTSPKIDKALDAPIPQGHPELIRTTTAIGVVAIFGASNFPFAFSVLGGDAAAALAAGCTVISKVHSAHPQTAMRTAEIAREALATAGFSKNILSLVHGHEAGKTLLMDSRISAGIGEC
jgi:NADP-dependent aldehyde dehydrogenase